MKEKSKATVVMIYVLDFPTTKKAERWVRDWFTEPLRVHAVLHKDRGRTQYTSIREIESNVESPAAQLAQKWFSLLQTHGMRMLHAQLAANPGMDPLELAEAAFAATAKLLLETPHDPFTN